MPITLSEGESRQLLVRLTPISVEPARLSGFVVDAAAPTVPIAGAQVELSGPYYYSAITNIDGYYDISGIVPGTYDGLVTAAGYIDYPF